MRSILCHHLRFLQGLALFLFSLSSVPFCSACSSVSLKWLGSHIWRIKSTASRRGGGFAARRRPQPSFYITVVSFVSLCYRNILPPGTHELEDMKGSPCFGLKALDWYNFNNQFYLKWTYSILDTLRFVFIHGSWELLSGGCLTSQLHTDRHPSKTDWASNTVRYYQHEPCLSLTCSYFWALHIDKCIPWLLTLTLTIGNICLISILALTLIWS